jgi:hypothetical protein
MVRLTESLSEQLYLDSPLTHKQLVPKNNTQPLKMVIKLKCFNPELGGHPVPRALFQIQISTRKHVFQVRELRRSLGSRAILEHSNSGSEESDDGERYATVNSSVGLDRAVC